MSSDITQWLDEIKTLRAQMAELQRERDDAYGESASWRDRYEAERQLRVRESLLLKQQIETLEDAQAHAAYGTQGLATPTQEQTEAELLDMLSPLTTPEALKQFLGNLLQERDRLRQALQEERQAHQDTRENLSIALGDTIDLLTQRSQSSGERV